jgi:phosphopantothenoylcysteine decarboxylase / phosphopantothenate---cysteine ligase
MLQKKKILVGVCGGIAAYKIAYLIRGFVKEGAEVKVIMTPSAREFIAPLTLSTLSKNPVLTEFYSKESGEWTNHVELGSWADVLLIAPATANTIAKCANGLCDNLLSAVYLSARCPVFFAPAMDLDMYQHPSVRNNLELLKKYGNHIIDAEVGELASGLTGVGRLAEPEIILEKIRAFFSLKKELEGKKVLVTAGPTYEALDPVRFIGNHSSGKMGYAIATSFAKKGAEVVLISGPTNLTINSGVRRINVNSAEQMFEASKPEFEQADIAVFAAAVADYRPKEVAGQKIKKKDSEIELRLIKNVDIAAELGKIKKKGQITVGFALETENEEKNAKNKLKNKNFDLIVLNSLNDKGAGFKGDTNKIKIIDKDNKVTDFGLKLKQDVAEDITETVISFLKSSK